MSTNSFGQTATDSCLPHENGPPYWAYLTIESYRLPLGSSTTAAVAWYARMLAQHGWTLRAGSAATGFLSYRKGAATLAVQAFAGQPALQVSADYLGARPPR